MDKAIMSECYADTLLIETLVPSERGYNHKQGCFKVEAEMKSGKLKDQFAVGVIDNDKHTVKYLEEFEPIDEVTGSLLLWKHRVKHHYLIQICPALEKWVLDVCEKAGIDKAGIGQNLEDFKKQTKEKTSLNDPMLKELFSKIRGQDIIEVRKLKGWIKLLKEKTYTVEINELKNV